MKARKRWQYYCDHCKKSGAHSGHMRDHEMRCLKNPKRSCPMCNNASESVRDEAINYLNENYVAGSESAIRHVEKMLEHCPACTLSAILGTSMTDTVTDFDGNNERDVKLYVEYNYKEKSAAYMAEKRAEESASWGGEF